MDNNFDMKYKTKFDNIWDIEDSLLNITENCFIGCYEMTFIFYNEILKYSLVYHKMMFNSNDYLELYTNGSMIKNVIRNYWNENKLQETVDKIRDVNIYDKVNMILDTMDNFIDEENKVFVDFLGMVKNELPV